MLQGGIRETVDVWRVVFARPLTFQGGIRETIEVWRVSLERPSTLCAKYLLHSRQAVSPLY